MSSTPLKKSATYADLLRLPENVTGQIVDDWTCEILSPSTQAFDHKKKRRVYAEQSVPHLWFVDPIGRPSTFSA